MLTDHWRERDVVMDRRVDRDRGTQALAVGRSARRAPSARGQHRRGQGSRSTPFPEATTPAGGSGPGACCGRARSCTVRPAVALAPPALTVIACASYSSAGGYCCALSVAVRSRRRAPHGRGASGCGQPRRLGTIRLRCGIESQNSPARAYGPVERSCGRRSTASRERAGARGSALGGCGKRCRRHGDSGWGGDRVIAATPITTSTDAASTMPDPSSLSTPVGARRARKVRSAGDPI